MKQRYVAEEVGVTKLYLNVRVRIHHGQTLRWATVKVPLRLINEIYEPFSHALASEATAALEMPEPTSPMWLPLEKWE